MKQPKRDAKEQDAHGCTNSKDPDPQKGTTEGQRDKEQGQRMTQNSEIEEHGQATDTVRNVSQTHFTIEIERRV